MVGHAENFSNAPEMRVYGMSQYLQGAERSHDATLSPETRAWQDARTREAREMYQAEVARRRPQTGWRKFRTVTRRPR